MDCSIFIIQYKCSMNRILFPYCQTREFVTRCCIVLWNLQRDSAEKICFHQNSPHMCYVPQKRAWHETNEWIDLITRFPTNYNYLVVLGHGQAHPFFWGLACSIGAVLGVKTIGVARNLLPHSEVTEFLYGMDYPGLQLHRLETKGRQTGYAVLRDGQKRGFYYSIGWRIDLNELEQVVQKIHRNHALLPFLSFARHALSECFSGSPLFSF